MKTPDFHTHSIKSYALTSLPVRQWQSRKSGDEYFYSLQLHPWQEHDASELFAFAKYLRDADAAGEIGLDRVNGIAWDRQLDNFEFALKKATEIGKPLIIHEVKATSEVISLLKKYPTQPTMIHHFAGNPNKLADYLELGCLISYATFPASGALPPIELLGLESDDGEQNLDDLYHKFASEYHLDETSFARQMERNFNTFLGK